MFQKMAAALALLACWFVVAAGCGTKTPLLRLAVTTSTYNSGLLEVILPPFEEETGVSIQVLAVGTGQALALAERGEVEIVIVHAREREEQFMAAGHGAEHHEIMSNEFVIAGPASDPAGIAGQNAVEALTRIAKHKAPFVSRGDDSGTHIRERSLWKRAGVSPSWDAYLEVGQGMGKSLTIADEKLTYILIDRATMLAREDKVDLVVLCEGDAALHNPYSVITVRADRIAKEGFATAQRLLQYLMSDAARRRMAGYQKHGRPYFVPTAHPE